MSNYRPRVWVSQAYYSDILQPLNQHFDVVHPPRAEKAICHRSAEITAALADVDGALVTASESIGAAEVAQAHRLRVVSNVGVGYNHIDVDALSEKGVYVTNTPGVLTETTADFAFGLILATARRVAEGDRLIRAGKWDNLLSDMLWGQDVYGSTLGILGMGRIGQSIARRGSYGFQMEVIYHNRRQLARSLEQAVKAQYVDFDTLLKRSDYLVLMLPYRPENHHLIDAAALAKMKPHACLINMARGGIVDENALEQALAQQRLAGAGLDVFEGEPHVNPVLMRCPSIVLTPHLGMATRRTHRAMVQQAVDNLIQQLQAGEWAGHNPCVVNAELVKCDA